MRTKPVSQRCGIRLRDRLASLLGDLKLAVAVHALARVVRIWIWLLAPGARSSRNGAGPIVNPVSRRLARMAARRIDICSESWLRSLAGFNEQFKRLPFDAIRDVIETEFERPLAEVFKDFEPDPIAPGTVAQLHRARLKDGSECIVKVQLPHAESELRMDLRKRNFVLWHVARAMRPFAPHIVMREVMRAVPAQLNFVREAHSMDEIRSSLKSRGDVVIPRVYWRLTTRRVLTMQLVQGIPICELAGPGGHGIDRRAVARQLFEIFSEQVLVHVVFHADPHAGNILVQPGPKLVLVDFGMAKSLPEAFRANLARLTTAIYRPTAAL